ncbi:MAG: NAD-dependent deacylase [Paludibacteraceae bacterium]|nr:NAD-dependent deacylase [Paludibacteraceae bacterium]
MKKLVVLTGAGISAESGIKTFRDSDGLWEEYRVEDVATPEGFMRNPEMVLDFYNQRRKEVLKCVPNYGHVGLAELEKNCEVYVITQNIDNLHEKAGSSSVLHLHGEVMKVRSVKDETLITELQPDNCDIHIGDKASDGAQLRPHIVWFGEAVPNIEPAIRLVEEADAFLIVGTSLNVYPAAGLVAYVRPGVPVYLIDPKPVAVPSGIKVKVYQAGASEGMKQFMADFLNEL